MLTFDIQIDIQATLVWWVVPAVVSLLSDSAKKVAVSPTSLKQRGRTASSFIISCLIYCFNQFIKLVVRDSIIMFGSEASPKHFAKQNISHCVSNISHA